MESTTMTRRVAILAIFHETNTFSSRVTDLAAFSHRWMLGQALQEAFLGTRTVVGGFLDGAVEHSLDVVPIFGAFATPSGIVTAEALAEIKQQVRDGLGRSCALDGILLELHGAMAAEGSSDPEEEVLQAIREVVGDIPVAAVLDLHANMARDRLTDADLIVGYRTNPHVDTYERGLDAARHLAAMLSGQLVPVTARRGIPVISAPIMQRSDTNPMSSILARARELEAAYDLVDVTVHAGYAYADVPHLGMGVSVTARDHQRDIAEWTADALAGLIWQSRHEFRCTLPTAAVAFAEADALKAQALIAVVDTGDNINAGASGDSTWLLTEALAHSGTRTLATIWDPAVVRAADGAPAGSHFPVRLGGHSGPSGGEPLTVDAEIVRVSEGSFKNSGPMATGSSVSMGRAAVIRIGACDIVVQTLPVQPNDPELFRCMGLDPSDYHVVLLKGAAAVRAGWSSLVSRFIDAGTPGLSDSDLEHLTFRRAIRPIWPLDS
jgi:microcystin degradation protein MlrC